MSAFEANFDGLVGPTHNYAGLSFGNVASTGNQNAVASPKQAALQGLAKMKALHDAGFKQGVLAPHERPNLPALRQLGFAGSDAEVIAKVAKEAPAILAACSSASTMWTANAATVSPSADTVDGRIHFTPANLNNKFHRSIEHPTTGRILQAMFRDERHFAHHPALPAQMHFGDEGAANHTRFCAEYDKPGVEFFVFGQAAFDGRYPKPQKFPARQTLEASQAIARLHGLKDELVVYAQQDPDTIDKGVFHNDVISVGNGNVLFHHEKSFLNQAEVLAELDRKLASVGGKFAAIEVPAAEVSVEEAVKSYLFNSQLLSRADGKLTIVVPEESRNIERVWAYLNKLTTSGGPIDQIKVFDLKQSMQNGGGPACLRLRVAMSEKELAAVNPAVLMNESLFATLNTWVNKHYRDRLSATDLADPQLLVECRSALDELTQILKLGSVYPFQWS
ncbi:N-succinylarginine dihydrolase [Chitinimonas sp. BJB300]|uniref:N-succinylarginine dihydrolase n=1 Tax=Chitinimonas sp. BJB300 TaxID=1559339 RepID=UPI000C0FBB96|nr:N-succinylarginine dihydrolase [Chitinimonas sp. BJB300]PHV11752.1 N-succinylarginine dihydrolase [Chitinimonas sp. BJB300]TSJ87110.1 N-succinylarginine dihydrolase [Chitinimonas sp. BJB300]